jgi:hypothetical protein
MLRVLSLGAGVQSSTLALMMAAGEIEPVQHAIFADVGAEPASVYRWLDWLEKQLPFPVHRLKAHNLRDRVMARVRREKSGSGGPPFFTATSTGGRGMLPRQCTRDHKIVPIERKQRELIGLRKGQRGPKTIVMESVIGISLDESLRMKPARLSFVRNVYPLVEMRITRGRCLEWMAQKGHPTPPRSACTFCPYRTDEQWGRMKVDEPEAFADAVAIDESIRAGYINNKFALYVHSSLVPLAEVDFRGAKEMEQTDMFNNECEGMCGV